MKQVIHRGDTQERQHFILNKKPTVVLHPHLLYAGMLKREPRWKETAHIHTFLEVCFIKAGQGTISVGGQAQDVQRGDLLIYNPGVMHNEESQPDDPLEMYFFGTNNISLEGLPENCLIPEDGEHIIHTKEHFDLFDQYFSDLITESATEQYFSKELAELLVRMILLLILRIQTYGSEAYLQVNELFRKAKLYIDKHYAEIHTIDDICQHVYVSKYYLIHLFKEHTGKTPLQYIIQKKIDLAKRLLCTTTLPLYSVAVRLGYEDQNYFSKVFKRTENMTPMEYRRRFGS